MSLRFLIIDTDYPEFLARLYTGQEGLALKSYSEQLQTRFDSLSGMADFYARNLRALGQEAETIYFNNEWAQKAWARENDLDVEPLPPVPRQLDSASEKNSFSLTWLATNTPLRYFKPLFPLLAHLRRSIRSQPAWLSEILIAQIKSYRPDVLINQSMGSLNNQFLQEIKPRVRLLVGQHAASQLSSLDDFSAYDLALSSFPGTIEFFRRQGVPAELNRLAFEPDVLSKLDDGLDDDGGELNRDIDLSFIGSFYLVHRSRTELLEKLCRKFPQMKVFGAGVDQLQQNSAIRRCYAGEAWGREMYGVLRRSKITFNHHGDVLPYANNMRLYESTGVGSLLVTDWKPDLHEMFAPGKEVVAYRTPEECVDLIEHYLKHDDEREAIARAGQERALRDHTYRNRAQELVEIVSERLRGHGLN